MTGPLGPMDDDGVVDLLRAAGQGGRDASPADVQRAMAAGTKIRRRRQAMQVVGSGLAIAVVLGVGITTVSALDDGGRDNVATAPDTTPVPGSTGVSASDTNLALLAEALGPDFTPKPQSNLVRLDPDSATGRQLPEDYQVTAQISIVQAQLGEGCDARSDKALRFSACRQMTVANDRVVLVQDYRTDLQAVSPAKGASGKWTAVDGTYAFFDRGDSTYVWVTLLAVDKSSSSHFSRQAKAVHWLGSYTKKLAGVAADPRVEPKPGETENLAIQAADYLAQDMGDGWIRRNVTVVLDPDSDLASRLPEGEYQARTEAGIIDQAAFDQVCKARAGLTACDEQKLSGNRTVYSRNWSDRDIDGNMRGESAAYRAIRDGKYLLVAVSVYGAQISEAKRDAHVATLTEWYASVEEGLRKAVTDERLTALVVQLDNEDSAADPGTVSQCDSVPAPPPGEYDSNYDPATGYVTLTFTYAGDFNHSYTVDPRNDPTCEENADLKPFIDHVVETYEQNQ